MRKLLFLALLASVGFAASAKLTQFILRGYVEKQDYSKSIWDHVSVDSVYVSLLVNDSIPVDFKMLTGDDEMKFSPDGNLRMMVQGGVGKYSLIINRDGYEPLRHDFNVASEGQDVVYLRSLFMEKRRENHLNEVEVLGTAIKMVMKGDTVVYDSRAFKLAEGSTLDALVRQLPGATLADDGSITVNGKKVNSLLLNGNDFFQGDADVALKNLPAYTVDKIKVYDKAAKDDNLTLASQKLSDSPQDENLVMDVTLKKEFSMATIFNVEGGYGPGIYSDKDPKKFDNRYIGRAFVIGFGKDYRWSAYGNANNIRNTSKARSSNKDWGYGWTPDGELQVAMGGFDMFYQPNKKLELGLDFLYTDERIDKEEKVSRTDFYTTGNLYRRTFIDRFERRNHLEGSASLRYSGDNINIYFAPRVDWMRTDAQEYQYSANFNRNPFEGSRGAAIDSLFAPGSGLVPSPELIKSVTSSTYTAVNGDPQSWPYQLRFNASLSVRWLPKKWRGSLNLYASANDQNSTVRRGTLYDQPYMADAGATPLRRSQWVDNRERRTNVESSLEFDWNKRFMSETRMRTLTAKPKVAWEMDRNKADNAQTFELMLQGMDPKSSPLPSVTAPENITPLIDAENTLNSLFLSNNMVASASISYVSELIAPSDSVFNPTYRVSVNYSHTESFRNLHYDKPYLQEPFRYRVNDVDGTQYANAGVGLSSNNKLHYFSISADYSYSTSTLDLFTMLPTVNSSDPLNVYLGPESGSSLPRPASHRVFGYGYYYGNKSHMSANMWLSYYSRRNRTAQTAVFNPSTGITTHRPIAVNGNWETSVRCGVNRQFGPGECWSVRLNLGYEHTNSVDYTSSIGEPVRSLVVTDDVDGDLSVTYKLKNGTAFSVSGGTDWQHSRSPRVDFRTISAWKSRVQAGITFYLPWQIEGETKLRTHFRRGYEDSALNTTEWIWNASVQKSFIKGALTTKVEAVDILGQLSSVSYYVNAQARTERWTNSLPRYVMLTVSYRFNFTPKVLQSN